MKSSPHLPLALVLIALISAPCLLSATELTVSNSNDNGNGSLRNAVQIAQANDVIVFEDSLSQIVLTSGTIAIDKAVFISGPGADELSISGNDAVQIFHVMTTASVTIQGLTLSDGYGGEVSISAGGDVFFGGGAIFKETSGSLTVRDCEFVDNSSSAAGAGNENDNGGAVFIIGTGSVSIERCFFSGNAVSGSGAGGGGALAILGDAAVELINCTFYNNSCSVAGGGVSSEVISGADPPSLTIVNCTFFNNSGGGLLAAQDLTVDGLNNAVTLQNSIFDRSSSSLLPTIELTGLGTYTSNGGNIFRDLPLSITLLLSDLSNVGAGASGVASTPGWNGGTVRTMAISSGGANAVDHGTTGFDEPGDDGRAYIRSGTPDAGAYEYGALFGYLSLTPAAGSIDADVTAGINIGFHQRVTTGGGQVNIRHATNAAVVFSTTAIGLTGAGTRVLSFVPPAYLPPSTSLYVTIDGSMIVGPAGTSFAGISLSTEWQFLTGETPNETPQIAAGVTAVQMRSDETGQVCLTIADLETPTNLLVLEAESNQPTIIADAGIVQVGATAANTCFNINSISAATNGTVVLTFRVVDAGGASAQTTLAVTVLPPAPDRLAFSTIAPDQDDGFNNGAAASRNQLTFAANSQRISAGINIDAGAFNSLGQLSPPDADLPLELRLPSNPPDVALLLNSTAPVVASGATVTSAQIQLTYTGAYQLETTLELATAAGASALASSSLSVHLLPPAAVQIGLTSAAGNTNGTAGAGVGFDGFNGGTTAFDAAATVPITISSLDAANYLVATFNNIYPRPAHSTTLILTVDDPRVLLGGQTSYVLSESAVNTSGSLELTYNGTSALTTLLHVVNPGSLGSTSVSISFEPSAPIIQASLGWIDLQEDETGFFTLFLGDLQSDPSLLNITITSSNEAVIPSAGATQLTIPTATTTQFSVVGATNANGLVDLTITVTDPDGNMTSTSLMVNIIAVNDPPVIVSPGDVTLDANRSTSVAIDIDDADLDIELLTLTATSSNPALVPDSNLTFTIVDGTAYLNITPTCFTSGTLDVYVTAEDDAMPPLSSTIVIQVTITAGAPFVISGPQLVCPQQTVVYELPFDPLMNYDWAVCNGIVLNGIHEHRLLVNWPTGTTGSVSVNLTTDAGCALQYDVAVTAADVRAVPDIVTNASTVVTFNVLTNDIGVGLQLVDAGAPLGGTLTTNANGEIEYSPTAGFSGVDSFTYRIRDVNGCVVTGSAVEIRPANTVNDINLFYVESPTNQNNGITGMRRPVGAACSPDGRFVYISSRADNSIVVFERDNADGTLEYRSRAQHQINDVKSLVAPFDVVVSPDGKHLYAAAFGSNAVVVFNINQVDGELSYMDRRVNGKLDGCETISGINEALGLAISPDGTSLYVTGYSAHSLVAFRRDPNSGLLQFQERYRDGRDGVNGLRFPIGAAVSMDGQNVYAAGSGDNAISVFSRNPEDGRLTFLEFHKDGISGVDGLSLASDVAVSPDGNDLYVAGFGDQAVAMFKRAGDGTLNFNGIINGGLLDGIQSIEVSADGAQVYAAAQLDDALVVFKRNRNDGGLTYHQAFRDNVDGCQGLNGAHDLVVSPDSRHVYVASELSDALCVVYRNRTPQAVDDGSAAVAVNNSVVISVLNNDNDPDDGEVLSVANVNDGALGTCVISGGGTSVTYTAGAATGADSFTYSVEDGFGGSSTASVSIVVNSSRDGVAHAAELLVGTLSAGPNPTRGELNVSIQLPFDGSIRLDLVDMRGAVVNTLHSDRMRTGTQHFNFTLRGEGERPLPSGAYLLVLHIAGDDGDKSEMHVPLRVFR